MLLTTSKAEEISVIQWVYLAVLESEVRIFELM